MGRFQNRRRSRSQSHSRSAHQSAKTPAPKRRVDRKLPAGSNKVPYYGIPDAVRNCVYPKYSFRQKMDNLQNEYPSLFHQPTFSNYVTRMRTLIFIEEVQQAYELEAYNKERAFLRKSNDLYFLEIINLADRRPSLVIGGSVLAEYRKITFKGMIVSIEEDGVLLKFTIGFHREYKNQPFKMTFLCSRFNFRKQHYSIIQAHNKLGAKVLFPEEVVSNPTIQCNVSLTPDSNKMILTLNNGSSALVDWFNPELNAFQKIAIKNILRGECRPIPYVIFGPPGTGKTFTIVEAVLQIIKLVEDSRILIGTTSNSAADLLTDLLIESGFLDEDDFVRVVSHNYCERDLIPDNIKPYCATIDLNSEEDEKDRVS